MQVTINQLIKTFQNIPLFQWDFRRHAKKKLRPSSRS